MIKVLDCTLRDGGYNNNWMFGNKNILRIVDGLNTSNVDIIELGFITNKQEYNPEQSKFDTIERASSFIPTNSSSKFVCMINYGEYHIDDIPARQDGFINGIRVAFHKRNINDALNFCKEIKKKGYDVFIQPMVSLSYSDQEFIQMIEAVNRFSPYAFYIVDSFGVMKKDDLMRFYYLIAQNLSTEIAMGFHSHNNLQLSYSLAQILVDIKTRRTIIIDSSIMGMGRGAGNLTTELFLEYLNLNEDGHYQTKTLLKIVDRILSPIYADHYWGYSLPHYLSAVHNCHPNYTSYFDDKNSLKIEDIDNILSMIDEEKKVDYSKDYAKQLYEEYMSKQISDDETLHILKSIFCNKDVLVIAPGKSIETEKDTINTFLKENGEVISVSINFKPEQYTVDYSFISNIKRYDNVKDLPVKKIITSNIDVKAGFDYKVNYSTLLNGVRSASDNAGMLFIKLLINLGAKAVYLAGIDGFSTSVFDNYVDKDMSYMKQGDVMMQKNQDMSEVLSQYSKLISIYFLTQPKYVTIK